MAAYSKDKNPYTQDPAVVNNSTSAVIGQISLKGTNGTKKIEIMQPKSWKVDVDLGLMGAFIVTNDFKDNLKIINNQIRQIGKRGITISENGKC